MAQVLRCDTASIATGYLVCGNSGIGVLAEDIPSAGEHGASPLYNDLSLPADNGKHVRMQITTLPASGALVIDEYGRLTYTNADGSYQTLYQLYVDGTAVGSPVVIDFTIGAAIPLVIADLEVATELDQLTITRNRTLTAQGLEVATELDQPAPTKTVGLVVADLEVATELDSPTIEVSQGISLVIAALEVAPELDNVILARDLALSVDNLEVSPELDNVSVGKDTTLAINDLEVAPELDSPTVGIDIGAINLSINDLEVAPELTSELVVGRNRQIVVQSLEVQPNFDVVDIGLNLTLAIDNIEVSPELQNMTFSIPGSEVYGGSNSVLMLTPETQIMVIT